MRLPILHHPDPRLRRVAPPVAVFDEGLRQLVQDMAETMYDARGIGLAAPQVGVDAQIVVIDLTGPDRREGLQVFINPRLHKGKGRTRMAEGCLSLPGQQVQPWRFARIEVSAQDAQGRSFRMKSTGLLAICLQHECDHLRGVLMVDASQTQGPDLPGPD